MALFVKGLLVDSLELCPLLQPDELFAGVPWGSLHQH